MMGNISYQFDSAPRQECAGRWVLDRVSVWHAGQVGCEADKRGVQPRGTSSEKVDTDALGPTCRRDKRNDSACQVSSGPSPWTALWLAHILG